MDNNSPIAPVAHQVPVPTISNSPLATPEKFSEITGLPTEVLRGQLARGYWPTVRVGRRILVNIELLRANLLENRS